MVAGCLDFLERNGPLWFSRVRRNRLCRAGVGGSAAGNSHITLVHGSSARRRQLLAGSGRQDPVLGRDRPREAACGREAPGRSSSRVALEFKDIPSRHPGQRSDAGPAHVGSDAARPGTEASRDCGSFCLAVEGLASVIGLVVSTVEGLSTYAEIAKRIRVFDSRQTRNRVLMNPWRSRHCCGEHKWIGERRLDQEKAGSGVERGIGPKRSRLDLVEQAGCRAHKRRASWPTY